jgi:hypothetical protein
LAKLEIELGNGDTYASCECCGRRAPSVVGFVHRDGDAFAVYYAGWTEGHRRGVSLIVGIGEWDDDATPADRRSFGLRSWVEGDKVYFEVQEPAASRYGDNTYLGTMLSRSAALADPELPEVFHVAEHIVRDDPRVRAALDAAAA